MTMDLQETPAVEGREPHRTVVDWGRFRPLWDRHRQDDATSPVRPVSIGIACALWVLALLLVFLTWKGAADRPLVAEQVPYLVSGGLSAILLTLIGACVFLYGLLAAPAATSTEERQPAGDDDATAAGADVRPLRRSSSS